MASRIRQKRSRELHQQLSDGRNVFCALQVDVPLTTARRLTAAAAVCQSIDAIRRDGVSKA